MCLNLKQIFENNALQQNNETVMTPNFAHNIVHSSAIYYQNLIIIHESSKKVIKDEKIAKVFFNT